jgi:hypothetical protein
VIVLIADDLPAFERPAKAISIPLSSGQFESFDALRVKEALL